MSIATEIGAPRRSLSGASDSWSLLLTLGFTAFSVCTMSAANRIVEAFFLGLWGQPAWVLALPVAIAVVVAVPFRRVRYADFVPLMSVSLRSSAVGLLALLILEPVDYTLVEETASSAFQYVQLGYWVAIGLAGISVFRPAFIPAVALYVVSTRYLAEPISTLNLSLLDIRYMLDMALYLSIVGIALLRFGPALPRYFRAPSRQEEIVFAAFGLHLANYFWSAIAKIELGPELWTWVIENPTYNSLLFSLQNGTLPIGHWPFLVGAAFESQRAFIVPLNIAIVGFQLFAIVCVLRRHWLKVATYFYDLLHLGIWLFGGLFFWPWVWNNVTILLATRRMANPIALSSKAACILTIVLGAPGWPFQQSAFLGWFDVADARQIYFEAITPDGAVKVPTSFFLSHSYAVSHGYMDTVEHASQYPHLRWWGSARDYDRLRSSGTCPAPPPSPPPGQAETEAATKERLARIGGFIRAHHLKMLQKQTILGPGSFYWRFHHHPSNPLLYPEFNGLDLRSVTGYRLVVESVCHSYAHETVTAKVVGRLVEDFDV